MSCPGGKKTPAILGIIILSSLGGALWAGPVDPARAQKVTDAFLKAKTTGTKPGAISAQGFAVGAQVAPGGLREVRGDDGTLLAYVADLQPRGFIALSARTDIAPIVAYSFRTSFPTGRDPKNPLYRMVREDLRLRTKALAEHPELQTVQAGRQWDLYAAGQISAQSAGSFQQWPPVGSTATGGWVETAWEQGAPYNQFCPLDAVDRGRSYVGCMATAVAQILNYHRRCNVTFGPNDVYTMTEGIRVDADCNLYDFPSFAKLNGYVQDIQAAYNGGGELTDKEAAALSFASGVAMQMDYSSEGSGPRGDMAGCLRTKFGFYSTDMFGGLSAETYLVLQENLINRLPALLILYTVDASAGHAIVCDGYNTEGEYHLNFGWGDSDPETMADVWYHLPTDVYPSGLVITEALLNIQPEAPALETSPASLNFYGAPGQEAAAQTLQLQANGAGAQVTAISCPAGFVVGTGDDFSDHLGALAPLAAGQTATVSVKFRPQQAGGYYGALTIYYNDASVRNVILRGWSFEGGTAVPAGNVSGTWSADQSPYFVNGNIQVPQNGTLALGAGVKVFFTGPYSLTVGKKAKLTAQGTAVAPIEFTAWNRDVGWTGLRFVDSGSDDVLRYCWLTWAKKSAGIASASADANDADSYGGAIYCYKSDLTIENCRLTNNMGDCAGALYCESSWPVISNTLIANNTATGNAPQGGGLNASSSGMPDLRNCTIVNNYPGGVFAGSWDNLNLTNCIVWGNGVYQIDADQSGPVVTFCDVQGGYPGAGNWSCDPCFFNPSAGVGAAYDGLAANWALQTHSPCLNEGTDILDLPETDLAGAARTANGVLDLGAYENPSALPLLTVTPSGTADAGFVPINTSATIPLKIANTGTQSVTIQSVSIAAGSKPFSILTPVANCVLAPGESVPVPVAFSPGRESPYKGKLDIRSTASNAAHVQVALKGVGIAGTVVAPGSVSGAWTKAASPYVVTGDLTIGRNKTLTIEPGVTVKFAGHFGLTVGYRGTLKASGTAADPIVFTAGDSAEGWYGIRLINSSTDDVLQYCWFQDARKPSKGGGGVSNVYGGAILCYASWDDDPGLPMVTSPKIDSCVFVYNSAVVGGAIACVEGCSAVITKNTFLDNNADYYGAGIVLFDSAGTIANNVFARNDAMMGGALASFASNPTVTNNTCVANRPDALYLASVATSYSGTPLSMAIENNIFWQNGIYLDPSVPASQFQIRYNDIPGGWTGVGNIDQDPAFANPDADDYHLRSQAGRWDPVGKTWVADAVTSPCLDAGDPASDVGQEPAPNGQRINLGAYGGTDQASKSPTVRSSAPGGQ